MFPILGHKTADGLHLYREGVTVEMVGALRDIDRKKGQHKLWRVTHVSGYPNCVLVECPILPRGFVNTSDIKQRQHEQPDSVVDGYKSAMTKWEESQTQEHVKNCMRYLLVFPPGMELSNAPFQDDTFDGVSGSDIQTEAVVVKSKATWKRKTNVVRNTDGTIASCDEHDVFNYETTIRFKLVDLTTDATLGKAKKTAAAKNIDLEDQFEQFNIEDDEEG